MTVSSWSQIKLSFYKTRGGVEGKIWEDCGSLCEHLLKITRRWKVQTVSPFIGGRRALETFPPI